MRDANINEFAGSIGIELPRLREIFEDAGIAAGDTVSREDKVKLLLFLRQKRGSNEPEEPTRVSLSRRSFGELKGVTNAQGSNRQKVRTHQISVEMRKTRVYIKRGHLQHEAPDAPVPDEGQVKGHDMDHDAAAAAPVGEAAPEAVAEPVQPASGAPDDGAAPAGDGQVGAEAKQDVDRADHEGPEAEDRLDEPGRGAGPDAAGDHGMAAAAPAEGDEVAAPQPGAGAGDGFPGQAAAEDAEAPMAREEQEAPAPESQPDAERAEAAPSGDDGRGDSDKKRQERELRIADDVSRRRRKKKTLRTVPADIARQHSFRKPSVPVVREVLVPEHITVQDLAQRMAIKSSELIKLCMNLGTMVTINQSVDQETAVALVEEVGHKARLVREDELESEVAAEHEDSDAEMFERPPVITVMGHVDHGKTTLLDRIRSSNVADAEVGGITQHIGAYPVESSSGKKLTFLDTPGHEAFSTMRARGASATDIVVIVVAADDGLKQQTTEAIKHAKSAGVPIVVAVSKCDKDDADPARTRKQMAEAGVTPEEWGGDAIFVDVSAKTGAGIDALLESILLQAEVLELKAPDQGMARGVVLEAHMDKSLGAIATVLVQQGRLSKGDFLLSGIEYGRIRQLRDENGKEVQSAGPSMPVSVTGLSAPPEAGDIAMAVANERKARDLALQRRRDARGKELAGRGSVDVGSMMSQMSAEGADPDKLTIVLKADVQGTMEALRSALLQCSTDKVKVEIVSSGIGSVTASDVNLAAAGNSFLAGFNVRADSQARKALRDENIEPRYYSVIYDMVDDVKGMVTDMVKPEIRERIVGLAEVKEVFRASKVGEVAGCMVIEGAARRNLPIRVLRDNVVIYEGELESLRRFKEDVQEVKAGSECGIGVKNYKNIQAGDQIEIFERQQVKVE